MVLFNQLPYGLVFDLVATRDSIVDFVNRWSGKTGITVLSFLGDNVNCP